MPDQPTCQPTLGQYVAVVARVGLTSFGGGLSAWMLRLVVHERRWLTEAEFLTGLALCQVFPGINVVNLAIWMGYRIHGWRGAVAGALAIIVPPGIVMVGLFVLTVGAGTQRTAALGAGRRRRRRDRPGRRHGHQRRPTLPGARPGLHHGAVFLGIGVFRLPLLAVMAVMVPLSVALAWREPAA